MYNFLCLKLRRHWTESHQISARCTEMIANYSAEIKIAIFQSVWKRQRDEWRSSSNCGRIGAKIARFNSINFEIIEQKFTKFGHDVAWLLPLNLLKADLGLQSANPLSNAEAVSRPKGQFHATFANLLNLTGCHSSVHWATTKLRLGLCPFCNPHVYMWLVMLKGWRRLSNNCWWMDDDRQIEAELQHNSIC